MRSLFVKLTAAVLLLATAAALTRVAAQQAPAAPPAAQPAPQAKQPAQAPAAKAPAAQPAQPAAPSSGPAPAAAPAAEPAPAPEAEPDTQQAPPPQPATLPEPVSKTIEETSHAVEAAEQSLQRIKDAGDDLGRLRNDVDNIITETTSVADSLRPQLVALRRQIAALGPPPGKDQPAEPATVTAERARLTALAAAIDGAIKTAEVNWARARELIEKITDLRYQLFTRSIMERTASPLLPQLWEDAARDAPPVVRFVDYIINEWWRSALPKLNWLIPLVLFAAAIYVGLKIWVGRFVRRHSPVNGAPAPFFQRTNRVAWVAPLRAVPAIVAAIILYQGLNLLQLLYFPSDMISMALVKATALFSAVASLIKTSLAPRHPSQRIVQIPTSSARSATFYLQGIAWVYAADLALSEISRALVVPLSMTVVQTFAASLAYSGFLIGFLLTPLSSNTSWQGARALIRPIWLKLPLWVFVIGIIGATILGFVALGRFAAQQLVLTGVVFVVTGLLFLAIRALTQEPTQPGDQVGTMLETQFGLDQSRRRQLGRLVEVVLTFCLLMVAIPFLLVQWGFSPADIRDWFRAAFFGFEIGQFRISLAKILLGILLFTALLFLTRIFQRWLRDAVLAPQKMDVGIANSIDTSVGYAGIALSALLAVSYAGLDVTNLAIVAGALTVGIGFGLQSIVNNFVSGLILLVERPIKVGDWIVVGNEQGNVRRISVRATEIETFDRASLIIPNSELIMGRVLNWTHRNVLGRTTLKFTVDQNADPDAVLTVLRECAEGHPEVLKAPAPAISFDNFSSGGLEFTMRVTLADVTKGLRVSTELRTAVLKALRDSKIIQPAGPPLYDIRLRDLDFVKAVVQRALEQRAAQGATEAPTTDQPSGSGPSGKDGKQS